LMTTLGLSQVQAQAILDLQLRRLVALERQKILDEYTELLKTISYLEDLLANPNKISFLIKEEAQDLKSKYGDVRRSQLSQEEAGDFSEEDLIPHQEMVVTLSTRGYVKRVPSDTYKLQHRGGKGVRGMVTREVDSASLWLVADTHDTLLFFSSRGRVVPLKCHRIPQDISRTAKGTPIINLLSLEETEQITMAVIANFEPGNFLVLTTAKGKTKRTPIEAFANLKGRGLIAITLRKDDELIGARVAKEEDDLILVTRNGKSIRFALNNLRALSRTSQGVRGIRLGPSDRVVTMEVVDPSAHLLTVTSRGFGKLSPMSAFPVQHRGGSGVLVHRVGQRVGLVVGAKLTSPVGELMLMSETGYIIRVPKRSINVQGRSTSGVSLMKVGHSHEVVSIACPLEDGTLEDPAGQISDS
ncbi:MAG: DNA gyrase subunit A, partial [Chloroflexi bacterium]|nr:DNA gyrase subunit A [Chloroflexota bacterium]